jgi:putative peptidoglycan binding protein
MKIKGFVFVSCLAAGALITSPAIAKPAKKTAGGSSWPQRMTARTTQMAPSYRQYSGTRYYNNTPRYRANTSNYRYGSNYYGGTQYYYGGGYPYGSSSVWPYVAASAAPFVASSLLNPYSYYGGYPYNNSYYGSGYGYGYAGGSTVASVQRRLGELGFYHGVVDGVIGPRTRSAIATFESRNGLVVDGTISRPLLNRLGLA